MSITVPLHAVAAAIEDIDEPLTEKFLFTTAADLQRNLEYLWGLEIYTIDAKHERSIVQIRKSMQKLVSGDWGDWTLVPTEQTLSAMASLQDFNTSCPISERKSFLTEFSAPEYEYIFVPLSSDAEFFVLQPESAPQVIWCHGPTMAPISSTSGFPLELLQLLPGRLQI
ncbi:hypothetical protein C8J56DRAFT_912570 [Mycena floridula]|nr:hypothetical protein C8J56DRAFT_912570 [Mycena floridula]